MKLITSLTLGFWIRGASLILLFALVLWYVHFQARNFIEGPQITLADTYEMIHHSRSIPIFGSAHNIVKLTLNGKEIHTNEQGEFIHTLILEGGYTIMTLEAQDRFGRTESLTREYVYVPEST